MRTWLVVLGVVGLLIGGVWTLQGFGVIGGSFMSGSRLWLAIGLVVVVAGGWAVIEGVRKRPS
ncbi:hypothetical protein [Actinokineospora sp.]|uniref:hypothetical protein n=1 Tax=Actinokineospora sp. TaxID=1872133 RepID=UPI004037B20C